MPSMRTYAQVLFSVSLHTYHSVTISLFSVYNCARKPEVGTYSSVRLRVLKLYVCKTVRNF